jgi:hypothetical protein
VPDQASRSSDRQSNYRSIGPSCWRIRHGSFGIGDRIAYTERSEPPRHSVRPDKEKAMPCGRKRKRHKIATHKRKKRLRKNRHKKKAR